MHVCMLSEYIRMNVALISHFSPFFFNYSHLHDRKLREALDIQDAVVSPLLEKPNYTDFLCQMAKLVSRHTSEMIYFVL